MVKDESGPAEGDKFFNNELKRRKIHSVICVNFESKIKF